MPYLSNESFMEQLPIRPSANNVFSEPPASTSSPMYPQDTLMSDTSDATTSQPDSYSDWNFRASSSTLTSYLRAKNRRKRYLDLHPEYFLDLSLELADPLLYDRLIRRFQTARERELEGQRKGLSGVMETNMWLAEAKKNALANGNDRNALVNYRRGPEGQVIEEEKDERAMTKEEGETWWRDEMTQRFLRGDDADFEYKDVDEKAEFDDPEEERDIQDAYFESMESDFDTDGEGKEKVLTGETGIQDY
jgi:hypothetical protein